MPKTTAGVLEIFERDGDSALVKRLFTPSLEPQDFVCIGGGGGGGGGGGNLDLSTITTVEKVKQLSDLLPRLLTADPAHRFNAEETLDHPFFASTVHLVEAPKTAPKTQPKVLGSKGCECLVYKVKHSGEVVRAEMTWEQSHFNEAAAQFHLMLGARKSLRVREVAVCVNEKLKAQFESKSEAMRAAGKPTGEIWVFHGTGNMENIDSIIVEGFKVPPPGGETNGARYGRGKLQILRLSLMVLRLW